MGFSKYEKGSKANNLSYHGLNRIKKNSEKIKQSFGGLDISNCSTMQAIRKEFRLFIQDKQSEIVGKKEVEKELNLFISNPETLISGSWYENH